MSGDRPMTVAWFSYFPVEWLEDAPEEVRSLPRQHPATWQRVLLEELERRSDVRVHVVALRKEFVRNLTFARRGVTFHLIKTVGGLRAPSLFCYDTALIRSRLRDIRPDVVHAWGTENGAALVAGRLPYPSITTIQGLASWHPSIFKVTVYERLAAWLEVWCLRKGGVVTAESRFSCDYVRRLAPRAAVCHVDTVPDPLFHRVQRAPATGRFRILFSGLLGPRKGGDLLLTALDRLRSELDFELVVIGGATPEFLREMKSRTSAELWSRVSFRRNLQPAEVAAELGGATIFACPTRADTGPTAAKEAAVAGVPIVGSDVGGVPDYVKPDRNGLLFPSGSAAELEAALRKAAGHPLFGRGRVDSECLAELRDRLAPARMVEGFLAAYRLARERCQR